MQTMFCLFRLRNLAGDNCSAGGGGGGSTSLTAPRYQLAEHRYGREEMLALFDRNFKPPETLSSFGTIFIDKAQLPLALTQMTEDESVRKKQFRKKTLLENSFCIKEVLLLRK